MIATTQQRILRKWPSDTKCQVWYQNQAAREQTLGTVDWSQRVQKIKVIFEKEKCYLIDGDACYRDGVCYRIVKEEDLPKRQKNLFRKD